MTSAWTAASLLSLLVNLVCWVLRRRVPRLPKEPLSPAAAPHAILLKPVLDPSPEGLARCRAWLRSAEHYPGRASVVFTSCGAAALALERLAKEFPRLDVRVVSVTTVARLQEPGMDKTQRHLAAQATVDALAGAGDALLVMSDEDVEPTETRFLERIAAATPAPGATTTLTHPPLAPARRPFWQRVRVIQLRFANQVLALGAAWLSNIQGVLLGWTAAIWLSDLHRIGGWQAVARYVGQDPSLGARLAQHRIRTRLFEADDALRVAGDALTLRRFLDQQMRWSIHRRSCPIGLQVVMAAFVPFALPVSYAIVGLLAAPGVASALGLALAALASRWMWCERAWDLVAAPAGEALVFGTHVAGIFVRRVRWGPWSYSLDARARITAKRWVGPPLRPPRPPLRPQRDD